MAGEEQLRDYLKRVTVDLATARRRLAEVDAREHEPIAVIGMSCRFAGADTTEDYWGMLREGRSAPIGSTYVVAYVGEATSARSTRPRPCRLICANGWKIVCRHAASCLLPAAPAAALGPRAPTAACGTAAGALTGERETA